VYSLFYSLNSNQEIWILTRVINYDANVLLLIQRKYRLIDASCCHKTSIIEKNLKKIETWIVLLDSRWHARALSRAYEKNIYNGVIIINQR